MHDLFGLRLSEEKIFYELTIETYRKNGNIIYPHLRYFEYIYFSLFF